MRGLIAGLLVALAGCAPPKPVPPPKPPADTHIPDFAKKPYASFSRHAVVAIALREWRLFGQRVNDDPPGSPRPPGPRPEREQGLWQRVGEYWWLGLDFGRNEGSWTGRHDMFGVEFDADQDRQYPWSAAFVSYVMRIAGAGDRFAYSPGHWSYIDAARRDGNGDGLFVAERVEEVAPRPGDLICTGRGPDRALRYDDLPAGPYLSHCDIVVAAQARQISVVGGNVDDAVTMKHVPVTAQGTLAMPDGRVLDTRYAWMVVLRLRD